MEEEGVRQARDILDIARGIGPAAAALVQTPEGRAAVHRRLAAARAGGEAVDLQDAVLWVVHRGMAGDKALYEDFAGWLCQALAQRSPEPPPQLQGLMDAEDFMVSVLGDLVPQLATLEFRSRRSFLALLDQRLDWKLQDKLRAARAACRREDRRQPLPEGDVLPAAGDGRPSTRMADWRTFVARLAPQERKIVDLRSRGYSAAEIGERLQLKAAAVRKRLQRIRERYRRWQD